jgi:hypothetical protein
MEVFFFWGIVGTIVGALIGDRKGRAGAGAILGFLLGPIGWIVVGLGPDYKQIREGKKCPFCAELIKKEASVCRYCGRDLPPVEAATVAAAPKTSPHRSGRQAFIIVVISLLAFALVLLFVFNYKPESREATLITTIYPQDGSSALPAGTKVEVLSHSDATARIRYSGREFVVPTSVVSQSK